MERNEDKNTEIIVPNITVAGDFLNFVRLLTGRAVKIYKDIERFNLRSHPSLFMRAGKDQHFFINVGLSERDRVEDNRYINRWIQDERLPPSRLRIECVTGDEDEMDSGLYCGLEERSFGYKDKIKYTLNRRTGDLYFSRFREPISITLLKAIIRDADPKKQNKFEYMLRATLNENWKYSITSLFGGKANPESGRKEKLHILTPKEGKDSGILSKLEVLEETDKNGE